MIIRGALSGHLVSVQFYGPDDLKKSDYCDETQPENWLEITLPADEARALLSWLRGNRTAEYRSSGLTIHGVGDLVISLGSAPNFAIRLRGSALDAAFTREISMTLSLIIGRPENNVSTSAG